MWLGSVNSFTVCSALLRDPTDVSLLVRPSSGYLQQIHEKSSSDKVMRTPLSKQRNKHIPESSGGSGEIRASAKP